MLQLYTDLTPNGLRPLLMLEECECRYEALRVDTQRLDHRSPLFEPLNPAQAIPVLIELGPDGREDLVLPQSGAILLHLAHTSGRFLPLAPQRRAWAFQWFFQAATDITSASSWLFNAKQMPAANADTEAWIKARLMRALAQADRWLADHEYLAEEVSIADFLLYPNVWFRRTAIEADGSLPHLIRWADTLAARAGVRRAMGLQTDPQFLARRPFRVPAVGG